MRGKGKVAAQHVGRTALIYVRQSTMAQVREHTESTARQYALAEEAARLGWPAQTRRGSPAHDADGRDAVEALPWAGTRWKTGIRPSEPSVGPTTAARFRSEPPTAALPAQASRARADSGPTGGTGTCEMSACTGRTSGSPVASRSS